MKKGIQGFTIIEMMIAIAVFSVVVMVGMSTLLNASFVHQKSNDQRAVIDNLNFMLEDMSRNIRTGYNFRCLTADVSGSQINETPQNCTPDGGMAIVFEEAEGITGDSTDQWVYQIYSNGDGSYSLKKSSNGGSSFVILNTDNIRLSSSSGFFVSGALSNAGDFQQPLVHIRLKGEILGKNSTTTPFSLQTTVSQRLIDNNS